MIYERDTSKEITVTYYGVAQGSKAHTPAPDYIQA